MAFGIDDAIAGVSKLFDDAIDAAFPTPEAKASAQAVLIKTSADAAVAQMQAANQVMLAEEQSSDPWTSRARPSFLYVMYAIILAAFPMAFIGAVNPGMAAGVAAAFKSWLDGIPPDMWALFGTGYLGYTGARSYEKLKGVTQ